MRLSMKLEEITPETNPLLYTLFLSQDLLHHPLICLCPDNLDHDPV